MVTHGNLMKNEDLLQRALSLTEDSVMVSWLPLFHDMGLIGNVLQPLWLGGHSVLMSPMAFIKRPSRWLRAIGEFRAATSGAPNFAYDLCVRKVTDDQLTGVDLSSWTLAYNGAEPVREPTLAAFAKRFAPWGFSASASYPCYGLAEGTLLVTGGEATEMPSTVTVGEEELLAGRAVSAPAGRTLVSSGRTRLGRVVTVADTATAMPCPPGAVGEIWLSGPGLPTGYWRNPVTTEEVFAARTADGAGPYLRTGDLGFQLGGELYVTGRVKDLIIVGGRNHYPHDLENTAELAHPAVRTGCVAAFAVETGETERVVLVAGAGHGAAGAGESAARKRAEIVQAVRAAVSAAHGITADDVVLVAPNAVPKTSSGKLQRGACRAAYLRGEYQSDLPGRQQ
jgi:acyl-CoA synthetase (AMP-forming)/AMP-acid ligase II